MWVHLLISDAVPECRSSLMYFSLRTVSHPGLEEHISLEAAPLMCCSFFQEIFDTPCLMDCWCNKAKAVCVALHVAFDSVQEQQVIDIS